MTRIFQDVAAAIVAVLLTTASFVTVATVPEAPAGIAAPMLA